MEKSNRHGEAWRISFSLIEIGFGSVLSNTDATKAQGPRNAAAPPTGKVASKLALESLSLAPY